VARRLQLSPSTLSLFRECARCFWLRINRKLERPSGPFPSIASGLDSKIKRYCDRYRMNGGLPPLLEGRLVGRLSADKISSLKFVDPNLEGDLTGRLDDCLVLPDNLYAPLDHKTRASAPEAAGYSLQYYKLQMDVYTFLLDKNNRPAARKAFLVYYYPVDGELHQGFPFQVFVDQIDTNPGAAFETFRLALDVLRGPLPSPGPECSFCNWVSGCRAEEPSQSDEVVGVAKVLSSLEVTGASPESRH
jgi:hypothetical protein